MNPLFFEVRAEIEDNNNRQITTDTVVRVLSVDGGVNASPYHAAHFILNQCRMFSTTASPKDGGRRRVPLHVEILIFIPSTVGRNGYANGNTPAAPVFVWDRKPNGMTLREWGETFKSYSTDKTINALPLPGDCEKYSL
jgi:hypothetical protein